ncbi:biopolymer transport protein ExbD [Winogradskyella epiphytica]|uniref:Biopolymer transport protein ExbD n=1 Tax=Winogradskyella epiphytica TaxID=262005 RepID=A0A2V4WWJ6_9FLAO|nr:biopolymer transporter ExbD [Winogradskyella epiphytica]PYE81606.1 biopolymer transport protein ExbD [Winogradskyella epiphytica]GGW63937.1 biopolymer transporter ExbD [Winogradskyella epiphytica]
MKKFRRHSETVNAGSMADIAFLLLIFFLVSTTISAEKGILRKLPSICETGNCTEDIHERNLLRISMNEKQQIMIEDQLVKLKDVKTVVEKFLDNNGNNRCDYCDGEQFKNSSDHPKEAVISLSHDALTSYDLFVSVQDEITKAYYDLRERYAKHIFNKTPDQLSKEELGIVQKAYPFKVSEVMVKRLIEE